MNISGMLMIVLCGLLALPFYSEAGRQESDGKRVLVVGAGVAGLTLAQRLKEHGFEPTLVERSPVLRTGGYKIDIRGVALEVVKRMGVYDAICEARTDFDEVRLMDQDGSEIARVDIDVSGGRVEEDVELMRGDLCRILMERCDGVETVFGDSPTAITELDEGVLVEFASGESRVFDMVIGADGLHSVVRHLTFGEESAFVRRLGLYVSVFPIPGYPNAKDHEVEYFAPGHWVNVYNSLDQQVTRACFAFCTDVEGYERADSDAQKRLLRAAFEGSGPEVQDLLSHIDASPDYYFDAAVQVRMPKWSKGRVALVGDAAYGPSPLSGQGTSVALVGAYVLAEELAQSMKDPVQAFKNTERRLRSFTEKNQELVEFSLAAMGTQSDSWMSSFVRYLVQDASTDWPRVLKEFGVHRIHEAATSFQLDASE